MKTRLDQLLVERGLAESRERAQRLIRAGMVLVDEQLTDKPGVKIDAASPIRIKGEACPYVSRGGLKLEGALRAFGLDDSLRGATVLDVGASTGGFTDCLLQRGAGRVWAVDTGRGQLHNKLRQDPRVTLREQANARFLTPDWVGHEPLDLIVIDVAFISLRLVLPPLEGLLAPGGSVVALVKPQFEAGPADVGRGGVVREGRVHRRVLEEITAFVRAGGWRVLGLALSGLPGPAGNREFFLWLARAGGRPELSAEEVQIAIERVLAEVYNQ